MNFAGKTSAKDWSGQKYHLLTFKKLSHKDRHRNWIWELDCECGGTAFAKPYAVTSGDIQSCGCQRRNKECSLRIRKNTATDTLSWMVHLVVHIPHGTILGVYGGALLAMAREQVERLKSIQPAIEVAVITKFLPKRPQVGDVA